MKRKIAISFLILVVAIMCCACGPETRYKSMSNNKSPNSFYEQEDDTYDDYQNNEDKYEYDITYKREKDDHSPVVYITKTGKRYHTPNCHHTQNAYMKLTVKQAWDRAYTPCYFCCY